MADSEGECCLTRRQAVAAAAAAAVSVSVTRPASFRTRGVVLVPEDLSLADWPERAARAGLTTIALHSSPSHITRFVGSDAGHGFLARCQALRLRVEYEMHAMAELLPRSLFASQPDLFRMNEGGERTPDANLCIHAQRAVEIATENALKLGETLHPTTGRYFLWGDDGGSWCRCPRCRGYSDSDQALIVENHLVGALRRKWPGARLAHIAYATTLQAPTTVRSAPGVFLEFAPIERSYEHAIDDSAELRNGTQLQHLYENLQWFGAANAQVLEYWLDVSRFSGWKRPAAPIPWRPEVFARDVEAYRRAGVQHATTFAVWVGRDYLRDHGEPPLAAYGAELRGR